VRSTALLALVFCACAKPVLRGEHEYTVVQSHYSLEMLPNGEMAMPGWSFSPSANTPGQPDFGFGHGYGTTDFFIVHGIRLRDDEATLPLPELAKRWHGDLAVFGLHYAHVAVPGRAVLSDPREARPVAGVAANSVEFTMHYDWAGAAYDVYTAILRDPGRNSVVVVMHGSDPAGFQASVDQARNLAGRVRFDAPLR